VSTRPAERPGGGDIKLPGQGGDRPSTLPAERPGIANRPGDGNRPSTLPGTRPGGSLNKPGDRPSTLPGNRPGVATRPGDRPGDRPGIGTLPGERPGVGTRPGERPGISTLPADRPGLGQNRPGDRPWNRPENRPDWGGNWNNSNNNFGNQFNNWHNENNVNINNFQNNRSDNWNNINNRWEDRDWHNRFDSDEYWKWRQDVTEFRGDRCEEIWDDCWGHGYHDHFFNHGYWGGCWWGAGAAVVGTAAAVTSAIVSPWWWWRPASYTTVSAFYGPTYPAQPVIYDPGTTVIYEGDTIYINGESAGSATEYREKTIELATPEVETYPVPEPPKDEAAQAEWLPMGVWALTQQEQGDAVMFFQLSVDKDGIVAGAYKNIMTNDDQPVVGRLDKDGQRLAWHVGDNTDTVYETGLSSLTYDAASVFVHFGSDMTQTWLLVRLPSPEMPPGAVKLPEIKKPAPGTK